MAKSKNRKKLILLDVHAIIHRAYHALPDFVNSKGEPTGALYGLATMLMKIVADLKPDYIVACYDLPKKTFRHEAYDAYKAGRAKTDEALVAQLIRSREVFKAFSIPVYDCPGFEADDLLGTITAHILADKKLKGEVQVVIASGDMDTLQLVEDDNVLVYTLKKGINDTILYNEPAVLERFGFAPKFLPDYKGLRGDPSDNIIGIKGIGEKTATILITTFGTIEAMYKALHTDGAEKKFKDIGISERIFTLLSEGEEEALFSKTLATIRLDAPITFSLPSVSWQEEVQSPLVETLFRELEFKSLIERFRKVISLPLTKGEMSEGQRGSEPSETKEAKNEILPEEREAMQKAKIALWLLNSEITNPTDDDVLNYKGAHSFAEASSLIQADIEKTGQGYVLNNIEIPILPIITAMQDTGIEVDVAYLGKLSKEYHTELSRLEGEIWKLAGMEFNINSPKQLGEVIFDNLKIQESGDKPSGLKMKKTAGGARSTRESELEKLRGLHPIIDKVFQYRELQKLLSTYIDTIPSQVGDDGRLHAEFIQTGATTGRFSSANPNLQNIPIKSELGKNIRYAFVAAEGFTLASFDYSQIELRIAALLSQDSYFITVFKEGKDIHAAVASKVFNVPESEVTHEMRRKAKVINFGILYGMGVTALRQNLGGDRKEAQIFYDNYFAQFPTIADYLKSVKAFALAHGYTETLFHRRRYFPGINSKISFIKAMAERMAINAPIQGTATADIIKIGMKKSHDALEAAGLLADTRLVLQVHDELVYEIRTTVLEDASRIIADSMKNAIPKEFLSDLEEVPLEVSSGAGHSWGDLK